MFSSGRYPKRFSNALATTLLSTAILSIACVPAVAQQQLVNSQLSFQTQDQSMWDSGGEFIFEYSEFFGVDPAYTTYEFNPDKIEKYGDVIPILEYSVDPYFKFATDFRLGMEVGASVNGGSIDANLDYQVMLSAPDTIQVGQPFSLTGSATPQGTSGFQSSPANASAWVDGIVEAYFGGYARFVTDGAGLGAHDYRMGDEGFTDGNTNNTPYRTLVNVNYHPEIIGINRDESGQLHVLGENQGGAGSSYTFGPTTITAGNWNVSATGALNGDVVEGYDANPLVTAEIDVDAMVTTAAGLPPLGAGFDNDWGVIDIDVGYEVVDLTTTLTLGMFQDFAISSDVTVNLQFSENVILEGVGETNSYLGPLDAIPDITLLTPSVTVDPTYLIDAELSNETGLTFTGSVGITIIEGHVLAGWDAGIYGSGDAADFSIGPLFEEEAPIAEFEIPVFTNQFELGGFQGISGQSFVLSASVPGDLLWVDTTPGGSDFNTPVNWSPAVKPSALNDVTIDNGGTAIVSSIAETQDLTVGGTPAGGTLQLDPGGDLTVNVFSVGENGTVEFNGGSLTATAYDLSDGTLEVAAGITHVNAAPTTLTGSNTIDVDAGGLFRQTGALNGTGGFTKTGLGDMIISGGGNGSQHEGDIFVDEGKLRLEGSGRLSNVANVTVAAGAHLEMAATADAINGLFGEGTVTIASNVSLVIGNVPGSGSEGIGTFDGLITGAGALVKRGPGTFTMTGANDYSGGTTVREGRLVVNTDSLPGDVTNDSELEFNQSFTGTYADVISGTGSLIKSGSGILTLSGLNTYAGNTTIEGGRISVDTLADAGQPSGIGSGSQVVLNGFGWLYYTGPSVEIDRDFVLAGSSTIQSTSGTLTLAGTISGGGSANFGGTIAPTGTNTYTGGTIIQTQGTTIVDSISNIGVAGPLGVGSSISMSPGATLQFTGASGATNRTVSLSAAFSLGHTVDVVSGELTLNSSIFGGHSSTNLVKDGDGSLTVTGNNTYSGNTVVAAGTLLVSNTSGSGTANGSVTVRSGATLGGSGNIDGAVFAESGAIISPGNSPGELTVDSLDFESGSTLEIEIGGTTPGSEYDVLSITNAAEFFGSLVVSLIGPVGEEYSPNPGESFEILTAASLTGDLSGGVTLPELNGSLVWDVDFDTVASRILLSVLLPGDYNGDGFVNAADYAMWRDHAGAPEGTLANDVDGGDIGPLQYDTWRAGFGFVPGGGIGIFENATVPEPTSLLLTLVGVGLGAVVVRRSRRTTH